MKVREENGISQIDNGSGSKESCAGSSFSSGSGKRLAI